MTVLVTLIILFEKYANTRAIFTLCCMTIIKKKHSVLILFYFLWKFDLYFDLKKVKMIKLGHSSSEQNIQFKIITLHDHTAYIMKIACVLSSAGSQWLGPDSKHYNLWMKYFGCWELAIAQSSMRPCRVLCIPFLLKDVLLVFYIADLKKST